jgi:hypothetical protein
MTGMYFVLGGLAIFGFLPFAIVMYKMRLAKRILNGGYPTKAIVYHIIPPSGRRTFAIVHYAFTARDGKQYKGSLTIEPGKYRVNDPVDIFYLVNNPKRNAPKGAWGSYLGLIFTIILALFILFAVYKIHEMIRTGNYN